MNPAPLVWLFFAVDLLTGDGMPKKSQAFAERAVCELAATATTKARASVIVPYVDAERRSCFAEPVVCETKKE